MEEAIGTKLKNYRGKWRIKMREIAQDTGISAESLYKWEKGTRPSDSNLSAKLEAYLAYREKINSGKAAFNNSEEPIQFETGIILYELLGQGTERIITVNEDGLAPELKPGMKLCLSKLKNHKLLTWGSPYYFVDINGSELLRMVYPLENENFIKLCSVDDNKYPPMIRHHTDFDIIFNIIAVFIKY